MSINNDTTNEQDALPAAPTGTPATPATQPAKKAKAKAGKAPNIDKSPKHLKAAKAAKADSDGEATDRLPTTVKELKETKGGFVAHLFLTGKDRDAIAKELSAAFKLADAQSLKITRRITARVRLYQRVFELVSAK